ncbi:MAG: hypothetical protein HY564_02155 [Candidatus Jacksonbacteria bacterium]|nr:hypothetical protein [Candidatus Jacksonbacteria bacterium]
MIRLTLEEVTPAELFQNLLQSTDFTMEIERARRADEMSLISKIRSRILEGGGGIEKLSLDTVGHDDLVTVFPEFSKETKTQYMLKPHLDIDDINEADIEMLEKIREGLNIPAEFDVYHPRYIRLLKRVTDDMRYQRCAVEKRGAEAMWITREYWVLRDQAVQRGEPLILYKNVKQPWNSKRRSFFDIVTVGGIQVIKDYFRKEEGASLQAQRNRVV